MMRVLTVVSALLALPLALAEHGGINPWRARRHAPAAPRHYLASDELASENNTHLARRTSGAHFTYYAAGLGACGKTNSASDYVREMFVLLQGCILMKYIIC